MNFETFARVMLDNGVKATLDKALTVYQDLGLSFANDLGVENARLIDELEDLRESNRRLTSDMTSVNDINFALRRELDDIKSNEHNRLVNLALASDNVLAEIKAGKIIAAIKELRNRSGAGLKQSKEAVDDMRVRDAADRHGMASWEVDMLNDPWDPSEV